MSDRFVIDESNFKDIKSVNGQIRVELKNSLGIEADVNELCHHLLTVDGIREVETLNIGYRSCLKNVEIVKAFPNLQCLFLGGHNILSLDGLEMFKKGRYLNISIADKKRNIEKISAAPISSITLIYKKIDDLDAIKNCLSLDSLEIEKSPDPDFLAWENVPLNYLHLTQGKFVELCDISHIKILEYVSVGGCRKFERFTGDNSNVKRLSIVTCKKFDVLCLDSFGSLGYLTINDCAPEISLSDLPDLPNLRFLELFTCKVNYDTYELKKKFPKLELFNPSKITVEQALSLSKANADVTVKKEQKKYLNGVCV